MQLQKTKLKPIINRIYLGNLTKYHNGQEVVETYGHSRPEGKRHIEKE